MANNKAFKVKNGLELAEYAKDITGTAVDVFVYDTSKDSDGGAWRKRTQATSWYNETLNTATRGSRKEFPAVAVIVAEATKVTIYDGDDPDMPMWMVFNGSSLIYGTSRTSVTILNGIMFTGGNTSVSEINFLTEFMGLHQASSISQTKPLFSGGILYRNVTGGTWKTEGAGTGSVIKSGNLVNQTTNDVAMTVLPNAPIDAVTGLPAPTIAIASNGGVSVIKDDGTVVDVVKNVGNNVWTDVSLYQNKLYMASNLNNNGNLYVLDIPSADLSGNPPTGVSVYANATVPSLIKYPDVMVAGGVTAAGSTSSDRSGLAILSESTPSTTSMVAYTASDYATGWMNGAIKLATLSDTDDTDVTGTELVTNGDGSTTTGWTAQNATLSIVSGSLRVADNGAYSKAYQAITTEVGKTYIFTVNITAISGSNAVIAIGNNTPSTGAWNDYFASHGTTGVKTIAYTAESTTTYIELGSESTHYVDYDNISVRLAEEDRSVNGNGLQVFGTITKTAVETGADLVGYSGFGNGNYLKQPYNSDLDFGTGTFSITTWAKIPSVSSYSPTLVDRHVINQARILLYAEFGNQLPRIYIAHTNGSTSTYVTGATAIDDGVWHCWHANRRGNGQLELWIDGVKVAYGGVGVDSISVSTNGPTIIGNDYTGGGTGYMNGDMALTRISATAPSPEQIAKIYNDEKHLFQENAQATLYGTSDAVTALAYDDTTDLLHVGTSAGRSVFQGLRRVDNTTDAVGAAISASNGLVAED